MRNIRECKLKSNTSVNVCSPSSNTLLANVLSGQSLLTRARQFLSKSNSMNTSKQNPKLQPSDTSEHEIIFTDEDDDNTSGHIQDEAGSLTQTDLPKNTFTNPTSTDNESSTINLNSSFNETPNEKQPFINSSEPLSSI